MLLATLAPRIFELHVFALIPLTVAVNQVDRLPLPQRVQPSSTSDSQAPSVLGKCVVNLSPRTGRAPGPKVKSFACGPKPEGSKLLLLKPQYVVADKELHLSYQNRDIS